jgi:acetylornithine deacetylase
MSHSSTIITRIREAFDAGHALDLLQKAISIPSVTGDEANFARWLKGELAGLGVDASSADFAEGRPNVWGVRPGRGGADTLLLIGHTDTLHTRGWKERWAGSSPLLGSAERSHGSNPVSPSVGRVVKSDFRLQGLFE